MNSIMITGAATTIFCMTIILGLLCFGLRVSAAQEREAAHLRRRAAWLAWRVYDVSSIG